MSLRINGEAPDFQALTTHGRISFHDWLGSWAVLFSHPKDFTPVCTTELGYHGPPSKPEFAKRGVKLIGLSLDPIEEPRAMGPRTSRRPRAPRPNFPIIADADLEVAKRYGMLPAEETGIPGRTDGGHECDRTRSVFVIGPDKKVEADPHLPDVDRTELRRDPARDRLDAADRPAHRVGTPVNWRPGDQVIILPAVTDEEARGPLPNGWRALKPYLRLVPQPK